MEQTMTPGQAQWILGRLLADRRISQRDVQRCMVDMGREIQDIERRLAKLRDAAGHTPVASPAPLSTAPVARTTRRRAGKKKGHPRGIAGTLAVLLRSIPAAEHAGIAAVRADKGIKAAIKAAQGALKKR